MQTLSSEYNQLIIENPYTSEINYDTIMMEYQEKSNSISTIIEVNESSEFSKTNKSFKSNLTQSIVNTSMYSHKYKSKSYNKSIYNSVED